MPNGFGDQPRVNANDPASLGQFLGWMGTVLTHLYYDVQELKKTDETERAAALVTKGGELYRAEVTTKVAGVWNLLGGKNLILAVLILASGAAGAGLGRLL